MKNIDKMFLMYYSKIKDVAYVSVHPLSLLEIVDAKRISP